MASVTTANVNNFVCDSLSYNSYYRIKPRVFPTFSYNHASKIARHKADDWNGGVALPTTRNLNFGKTKPLTDHKWSKTLASREAFFAVNKKQRKKQQQQQQQQPPRQATPQAAEAFAMQNTQAAPVESTTTAARPGSKQKSRKSSVQINTEFQLQSPGGEERYPWDSKKQVLVESGWHNQTTRSKYDQDKVYGTRARKKQPAQLRREARGRHQEKLKSKQRHANAVKFLSETDPYYRRPEVRKAHGLA
jgi:hypothetical protein